MHDRRRWRRRERFADRHLKTATEMERLFRRYLKDASPVARTVEFAARCTFSLDELKYQYPDEIQVPGRTPQQELERLTWEKAPNATPKASTARYARSWSMSSADRQLDYAPYFLTVHSIVAEARRREILCQGRGSAANSAVCYVLGITSIDPVRSELLFERFVSRRAARAARYRRRFRA
jgi:error-prone DNA polymerase